MAGLYIETNIICTLVLCIILYKLGTVNYFMLKPHLLTASILCSILFFSSDTVLWLISHKFIEIPILLHYAVNIIFYSLAGIMSLLWFIFVCSLVAPSLYKNKTLLGLITIPTMILLILCINSVSTGWLFTITPDNQVVEGPVYMVTGIIAIIYSTVSAILPIHAIKETSNPTTRELYVALSIYPIFMIASGMLDYTLTELCIISVGITIPTLIIFFMLQNTASLADPDTLLYNKNWLYTSMLSSKMRLGNSNVYISLIAINDSAEIISSKGMALYNDSIRNFAYLLSHNLYGVSGIHSVIPCRFNQDEFILLIDADNLDHATAITKKISAPSEGTPIFKVSTITKSFNYMNDNFDSFISNMDEELFSIQKKSLY